MNKKILPPASHNVDKHVVPIADLVESLFDSPKIIGLCGDVSQAKSSLNYSLIDILINKYGFNRTNLYTYAMPIFVGEQKIYSVEELELITNSIIFLDEFYLFLNMDDRKRVKQLGEMMQRIKHSNNVLILCGLAHNFNKFISSQCEIKIYKQVTLKNLINGSPMKDIITAYNGKEKASTVLALPKDRALIHGLSGEGTDLKHYTIASIPYLPQYDVKLELPPILPKPIK